MNAVEIKKQMIKLWKNTFHDSDEYISLVFDNYFDENLLEYEERNGVIISALLGIPYDFTSKKLEHSSDANSENLETLPPEANIITEGSIRMAEPESTDNDAYETEKQTAYLKDLSARSECFKSGKADNLINILNNSDADNEENFKLRGLYLCGLATHPKYREGGIMSRLIEKINIRARDLNFDFTFLIPANDGLIKYYYDRNYVNAFYRIINRYLIGHDFKNELLNNVRAAIKHAENKIVDNEHSHFEECKNYTFDGKRNNQSDYIENNESGLSNCGVMIDNISDYYDSIKTEILKHDNQEKIENLKVFISEFEKSQDEITLCHSLKDIDIIVRENLISEGEILVASTKDNAICGVAFIAGLVNDEIDMRQIMAVDECVRLKLLSAISSKTSQKFPDATVLKVYRRPTEANRLALWRPVFGATDPTTPIVGAFGEVFSSYAEADFPEIYGMVRLLKCDNVLKILGSRRDSEIKSILVGDLQTGIAAEFATNNGYYRVFLNENSQNDTSSVDNISGCRTDIVLKQFAEIIFRRPKSPKIVSEAFGISNLPMNMSLMLD